MKYRTRLILVYAAIAFVISIFMGMIISYRGLQYENRTEKRALEVTTSQLVTQMEDRLDRMDSIMNYILSDPSLLDNIRMLGLAKETELSRVDILRMETELNNALITDFIYKNSYRTVFCNADGVLAGTQDTKSARKQEEIIHLIDGVEYLKDAETLHGKSLLVGPHVDPWDTKEGEKVFSLVKAIRGHNMGFMETQNLCDSLMRLEIPSDNIRFHILLEDGTQLYDSNEQLYDWDTQIQELPKLQNGEAVLWKNMILCGAKSKNYGFSVETMTVQNQNARHSLFLYSTLISVMMFGLSLLMILIWSNHLMKPIEKLRQVMEHTNLDNLRESMPQNSIASENDEFKALEKSYRTMTRRLDRAVQQEQKMSVLQLQAQLDTLQAQVNPHFIYNVLNIISAKGVMDGDESICEMCAALASMLQYSTSNKQRYATVSLEQSYLENYFYLMKCRYETKFEFMMDIPPSVGEKIIPKMVLQQVVENSMVHAFEKTNGIMKVMLFGEETAEYWQIRICDNGSGFSDEKLKELRENIQKMRETIDAKDQSIELEIGGMGLISTYARCYLLLGKQLIFTMENEESGSARVTIGKWKV